MTSLHLAWRLTTREWKTYVLIVLMWLAIPWYGVALGLMDLSFGLRFSWIGLGALAVYLYRRMAVHNLLLTLPVTRREVWGASCLAAVVVPTLVQIVVSVLMLALMWSRADVAMFRHASLETLLLGGLYSVVFLQLVLLLTPGFSSRRQSVVTVAAALSLAALWWYADFLPETVGAFTSTSALLLWATVVIGIVAYRLPSTYAPVAPLARAGRRFTLDVSGFVLLNRLTGVPSVLVAHTLLGVVCFGGAFLMAVMLPVWFDSKTLAEATAEQFAWFHNIDGRGLLTGDSILFLVTWVIGFANIWTPLAQQLRVLPLTPRTVNTVFLTMPLIMWAIVWVILLAIRTWILGYPGTLRLDILLAVSGTSTLANVISFRWRNRLYGMAGAALMYGFWSVVSVALLVTRVQDARVLLALTGVTFLALAVRINHHTIVHSHSAAPAYQRQPKFFDTPARS
jgi:hypothetical protein